MHGRRAEGKGCRSSRCILRRRTSSFTYFPMCIAREGEELLQVVHVHDDVVFAACSSCFDPATVVFVLSSRSLRKLGYETISPSIHIKLDSHRELEFHPHLTQKLGHNPRWGASSMATSFNLRLPPWAQGRLFSHRRGRTWFRTRREGSFQTSLSVSVVVRVRRPFHSALVFKASRWPRPRPTRPPRPARMHKS